MIPSNSRELPTGVEPVTLRPLLLRSGESPQEIKLRSDVPFWELHLPWMQREHYSSYQAVVRRVSSGESFTIRYLRVENNNGTTVHLRLSANFLTRGTYLIQLIGTAPDGSASQPADYQFTVGG
jgi:hypothetical protein